MNIQQFLEALCDNALYKSTLEQLTVFVLSCFCIQRLSGFFCYFFSV